MMKDKDRLLTIDELSGRFQFAVPWIRRQVKLGIIPALKFNGRAWRFQWPTVLAALQSKASTI